MTNAQGFAEEGARRGVGLGHGLRPAGVAPDGAAVLFEVNACRKAKGEAPLGLKEMQAQGLVEYVTFPEALKGKYQSFTQADISALRTAGYDEPFLTVEQGVERYVGHLRQRA